MTDEMFYAPCLLCLGHADSHSGLCSQCFADIQATKIACAQCAIPLAANEQQKVCGSCLASPPFFDSTVAATTYRVHYQTPIRTLLAQLKYRRQLTVARTLAQLLATRLRDRHTAMPEYIVPVPLSRERLRERGYNQAHEIACLLARTLGVRLAATCIHKHSGRLPQTGLSRLHRQRNATGAYRLHKFYGARRVAIVDDVMTTGATVNEIARLLKRHQVAYVEAWVVARAVLAVE